MRAAAAGFAYFALIFTAGVILGIVRAIAVAPHVGATAAGLIELTVMLAISWLVCGWSFRFFGVPDGLPSRAQMGAVAFLLLMTAELILSLMLPNGSVGGFLAAYQSAAGLIGLGGQLAFALFPLAPRRSTWKAL
jgi:hypothetical protein